MLLNVPEDASETRFFSGDWIGYLNVVEPPVCRDKVRRNFFSQRYPRTWSSLPDHVKRVRSVDGFKAAYDDYQRSRWIQV